VGSSRSKRGKKKRQSVPSTIARKCRGEHHNGKRRTGPIERRKRAARRVFDDRGIGRKGREKKEVSRVPGTSVALFQKPEEKKIKRGVGGGSAQRRGKKKKVILQCIGKKGGR